MRAHQKFTPVRILVPSFHGLLVEETLHNKYLVSVEAASCLTCRRTPVIASEMRKGWTGGCVEKRFSSVDLKREFRLFRKAGFLKRSCVKNEKVSGTLRERGKKKNAEKEFQ